MLLNLIKNQQPDIDRIYLCTKDPSKSKYQLLINRREKVGIKKSKALIDYSQTADDIYENCEDYNPTKKRRLLIVFDDMIADMKSNKKTSSIVTTLCWEEENLAFLMFLYQNLISNFLELQD